MNPSRTRRAAVFLYGIVAYAVGAGSLAHCIAVTLGLVELGGVFESATISGSLAWNVLLLFVFGLQHSVMARRSFKERWVRWIGEPAERSTFVLTTGLVLSPVLLAWHTPGDLVWSTGDAVTSALITVVAIGGWVYLLMASFAIDHFELFGLRQVYEYLRGGPRRETQFQSRWMYRFDRHPIMTGALIGLWFTPTMSVGRLMLSVGMTLYIIVGVSFEERALRRELGREYEHYAARVGTIVPTFAVVRRHLSRISAAVLKSSSGDGRLPS